MKPPVSARTLKRSSAMAIFLLLVFLFLACRIFAIQVFDFDRYQKKVLDQLTTESPVRAERGGILDAAGRVLAANRTVYRISLFPNVITSSGTDTEKLVSGLCAAVEGLEPDKVREHLSHQTDLERTVVRSVDRATADKVLTFIAENNYYEMLTVEAVSERYYPYGSLASHVLGFTGSDGQGLYGLELQYDKMLAGQNGAYITARDSTGNRLPNEYESFVRAEDGYTMRTTIDAFIQATLEEQLKATLTESAAEKRVCGIVMDVKTGAILAMATAPSFDLNHPFELNAECAAALAAEGLTDGSEEYLAKKAQLLLETWSNKAATEIYMPGSTFKALTCSAVLEEKAVIDLDERFFCSGSLRVADRTIHCHKKGGHGSLTFREGLQNSCNPVMMTVAARLGCDTFYQYVEAFGLLEKTGIDLPGEGNSIFHAKSRFKELDLATASFGQNFKVSVLQMITAISAIANGGELLTPYLVETMSDENGNAVYSHEKTVRRQVISAETAKTICEILAGGVAGNGGAKNAYVPGYRIAAKTGTSEKIGDNANARIGSCVGFAPADDPQVAVIIVVDEPTDGSRYGSVVAAPYVANVFRSVLPYLSVEPVYTEEELENLEKIVPNCVGWSRERAERFLTAAGFEVIFSGEGSVVTAQTPESGSSLTPAHAKVVLTLGSADFTMVSVPDLIGKSAEDAARILLLQGFNLEIVGARSLTQASAAVKGQFPAAGTSAPYGSAVRLYFPYEESEE